MSFGFHPLQIATRGTLDGQYGVATRGFFILPDIVPRFPAQALVGDLSLVGQAAELDFTAALGSLPRLTFLAVADDSLRLVAEVGDDKARTLVAKVDGDKPPHC